MNRTAWTRTHARRHNTSCAFLWPAVSTASMSPSVPRSRSITSRRVCASRTPRTRALQHCAFLGDLRRWSEPTLEARVTHPPCARHLVQQNQGSELRAGKQPVPRSPYPAARPDDDALPRDARTKPIAASRHTNASRVANSAARLRAACQSNLACRVGTRRFGVAPTVAWVAPAFFIAGATLFLDHARSEVRAAFMGKLRALRQSVSRNRRERLPSPLL